MKRFVILIPVFNDWESLSKLLLEIDSSIKDISKARFDCVIINDASTIKAPKLSIPRNINSIKIINMKLNKGHARCNAFGIRYLSKLNDYDYVILMDGDGEDRPVELKLLIQKIFDNPNISVVAKRIKRSEGIFFQFLYQMHKLLTFIFAGKNINFGNYSCLTKNDIKILSDKESLWSSFSGSVKKHILNFNTIDSIRGLRYFGPSKMSLFKLGIHSFSIIAVFRKTVFIRSFTVIFISAYLIVKFGMNFYFLQFLLIFFNILIFLVSLRENRAQFLDSDKNVENQKDLTH